MTTRTPERLWTVEELADYLQVAVATIYDWRYRGDAPKAIKLGKQLRFRSADVYAWVRTREDG